MKRRPRVLRRSIFSTESSWCKFLFFGGKELGNGLVYTYREYRHSFSPYYLSRERYFCLKCLAREGSVIPCKPYSLPQSMMISERTPTGSITIRRYSMKVSQRWTDVRGTKRGKMRGADWRWVHESNDLTLSLSHTLSFLWSSREHAKWRDKSIARPWERRCWKRKNKKDEMRGIDRLPYTRKKDALLPVMEWRKWDGDGEERDKKGEDGVLFNWTNALWPQKRRKSYWRNCISKCWWWQGKYGRIRTT